MFDATLTLHKYKSYYIDSNHKSTIMKSTISIADNIKNVGIYKLDVVGYDIFICLGEK